MIGVRPRPRKNLVCWQSVELVTDYLEGALSQAQRRRLEAHLTSCRDCPEYLAQIRATIALTGGITPGDLTPQMRDEFIGLYRRWRADEEHGIP
ncbi:MAG TPA: zf-HC2 domain-containing protein [Trebonia sp.]